MIVAGALGLLLLAAAVVVLYAMIGELASRIPDPEAGADRINPLDDYNPGAAAPAWPASLGGLGEQDRSTLVVLSPVCDTCNKVAAELSTYPVEQLGTFGVVVSCSTREAGDQFISRYGLERLPHLADEGGAWVTGNFGVKMSPSALLFEDGRLGEAYTFGKIDPLLKKVNQVREGVS